MSNTKRDALFIAIDELVSLFFPTRFNQSIALNEAVIKVRAKAVELNAEPDATNPAGFLTLFTEEELALLLATAKDNALLRGPSDSTPSVRVAHKLLGYYRGLAQNSRNDGYKLKPLPEELARKPVKKATEAMQELLTSMNANMLTDTLRLIGKSATIDKVAELDRTAVYSVTLTAEDIHPEVHKAAVLYLSRNLEDTGFDSFITAVATRDGLDMHIGYDASCACDGCKNTAAFLNLTK